MARDWSISSFYKQAWKLTKTHKELWILGLAVAVFTAGGNSSNWRNSLDDLGELEREETEGETGVESVTETEEESEPTYTELVVQNLTQVGSQVFQRIPGDVYGLFILEILLAVVVGVIWSLVVSAWSEAALIQGVAKAFKQTKVDIAQVARSVVPRIGSMIWLSIVPLFLAVILLIAGVLLGMTLFAIHPVVGVIYLIVSVLVLIYGMLRLSASLVWAVRLCVLEELSGRDSFVKGWKMAKGTIRKVIGLGFVNVLVWGAISIALFIPVGIVGFASIWPMIQSGEFVWQALIPVAAVFLLTLPVQTFVNAIGFVFRYATWHLGFESVTEKEVSK